MTHNRVNKENESTDYVLGVIGIKNTSPKKCTCKKPKTPFNTRKDLCRRCGGELCKLFVFINL
jgi:rRNA maturation endonuclease Nob1